MADPPNGWTRKGSTFGTPNKWGVKDVLFSLTRSAFRGRLFRFVQAINNHFDRASIPDYGTAMEMVEKYLETVFSPVTTCNVVVNSHVMFTGAPEQQGVQKGFPLALGSKLPPKVPRYFNSMLSLEKRKGQKGETQVVLCTQMTPALDLKTPAPSIIPAEMSPDLAMFSASWTPFRWRRRYPAGCVTQPQVEKSYGRVDGSHEHTGFQVLEIRPPPPSGGPITPCPGERLEQAQNGKKTYPSHRVGTQADRGACGCRSVEAAGGLEQPPPELLLLHDEGCGLPAPGVRGAHGRASRRPDLQADRPRPSGKILHRDHRHATVQAAALRDGLLRE